MGTFSSWLLQHQHRDDVVGDLARDFSAAVALQVHPEQFETPEGLLTELSAIASPEALDAVLEAGQQWRNKA